MKTVTSGQFYHNTKLVDEFSEGEHLVVTSNGKPKFLVSRCGKRPLMTRKLAEEPPSVSIRQLFFAHSKNESLRENVVVDRLQK